MRSFTLLIGVFLVAILVVLIAYSLTPSTTTTPHAPRIHILIEPGTVDPADTFTALLLPSLPDTIVDLQGEAETFQGYGAYLRFGTDSDTLDKIIATGFRSSLSPSQSLKVQLRTPPVFTPPWEPQSITNPEYYSTEIQNGWTHSGIHDLIVDRKNGIVYFIGHGS